MPYEDVKAKCFFCEATIEGNQRFMLEGRNLPTAKGGRVPSWLKAKPEHKWAWNGLGDYIQGEHKQFLFYLCPAHQTREYYQKAFDWAQAEIDKLKTE